MATTRTKTIQGDLADYAVSQLEAKQATVIDLITKAEGSVEAAISNAMKNAPAPKGLLGIVYPAIEAEIATYDQQLITQYGAPAVLFALLDREAHAWATALGG